MGLGKLEKRKKVPKTCVKIFESENRTFFNISPNPESEFSEQEKTKLNDEKNCQKQEKTYLCKVCGFACKEIRLQNEKTERYEEDYAFCIEHSDFYNEHSVCSKREVPQENGNRERGNDEKRLQRQACE